MLTFTYPPATARAFLGVFEDLTDRIEHQIGESVRSSLWMVMPVNTSSKTEQNLLSFVADHLEAGALDGPVPDEDKSDVLIRLDEARCRAEAILEE